MPDIPITYPGRYAPGVAMNFADSAGNARQVSATAPLPVTLAAATGSAPPPVLTGTASAAAVVGPLQPVAGKPLVLVLTGTWTGRVRLLRSIDGGTNKLPVTLAGAPWAVFTGNVCEPAWDESDTLATFYLDLVPATGAISYRLGQ
ncbi:MAG: hypothetical protein ABIP41_05645 [Croceibacterium sp.]